MSYPRPPPPPPAHSAHLGVEELHKPILAPAPESNRPFAPVLTDEAVVAAVAAVVITPLHARGGSCAGGVNGVEGVDCPRVGFDRAGQDGGAVFEDVQVPVARANLSKKSNMMLSCVVFVYSCKKFSTGVEYPLAASHRLLGLSWLLLLMFLLVVVVVVVVFSHTISGGHERFKLPPSFLLGKDGGNDSFDIYVICRRKYHSSTTVLARVSRRCLLPQQYSHHSSINTTVVHVPCRYVYPYKNDVRTTAVFPTNVQQGSVCFLPFPPNTPRQWLRFRPAKVQKLTCRSPQVTSRVPEPFHATLRAFRRPPLAVACI